MTGKYSFLLQWRWLLVSLIFCSFTLQAGEFRILGGVKAERDEAPFLAALLQRDKSLRVAEHLYRTRAFSGTKEQSFEAPLSDCGYGFDPCADAQGKVCLIARGTITFAEKVANCAAGGGIAALIYNYFPSEFLGSIGEEQSLPVYSISSGTGQKLLAHIGQKASFDYPHEVADSAFFCGGSYLGEGWVLTAAHCVVGRTAKDVWIGLGSGDYRDGRELYQVDTLYVHDGFQTQSFSLGYDIALLKLKNLPDTGEAVALADWAEQLDAIAARDTAQIYGRGEQNIVVASGVAGSSGMTHSAFASELNIVDSNTCQQAMQGEFIEKDMLCAGGVQGLGTCFGDSGGPLLWRRDGQLKLIGVVSWGVGCGLADQYDVFASVASYRDAIQSLMNGESETLSSRTVMRDLSADTRDVTATNEPLRGGGGAILWLTALLAYALSCRPKVS